MAQSDVNSTWQGAISFAVVSTERSLRFSADVFESDADRYKAFDYIEVDNRGNEGPTTYGAVNGRTASFVLPTTAASAAGVLPTFRLPPDAIVRMFIRATSIRVASAGALQPYP